MVPTILVTQDDAYIQLIAQQEAKKEDIHGSGVFHIRPEKTTIGIDQIRDVAKLAREAHSKQLVVIYDFHTAKPEAQNALLKTLEEGSERSKFILIVENEADVLPTIRSRSVIHHTAGKHTPSDTYLEKYGFLTVKSYPEWLSATSKLRKEQSLKLVDELIGFLSQSVTEVSGPVLSEVFEVRSFMHKNNLHHERAMDEIGRLLDQARLLPLRN